MEIRLDPTHIKRINRLWQGKGRVFLSRHGLMQVVARLPPDVILFIYNHSDHNSFYLQLLCSMQCLGVGLPLTFKGTGKFIDYEYNALYQCRLEGNDRMLADIGPHLLASAIEFHEELYGHESNARA